MGTKRKELEAAARDCPEINAGLEQVQQGVLDYESALEAMVLHLKEENDRIASELGALTECDHEWEEAEDGIMACANIECLATRPKLPTDT